MSSEENKRSLRIVFMGTPEFAVESLNALIENNYQVVGIVTMPDKPAGRGYKLQQSAVKKYAKSRCLPILQPEKLKNEDFLHALRAWKADLQIVVAFRMLPEVVWNMPRLGTFNLHASLLPQYRGAAPINWAIINGEKETGVTTFFLTHKIDTGAIILQEKVAITKEDNAETVHDKLMYLGADLVLKTVDAIIEDKVTLTKQDYLQSSDMLKPAPKIFKETCRIDWSQPVEKTYNFIRGLSPYPAAWTNLVNGSDDKIGLKVFDSEIVASKHTEKAGKICTDGKNFLDIATFDGFLRIKQLQIAGKKRMKADDFLRGFSFSDKAYVE